MVGKTDCSRGHRSGQPWWFLAASAAVLSVCAFVVYLRSGTDPFARLNLSPNEVTHVRNHLLDWKRSTGGVVEIHASSMARPEVSFGLAQ